MLVANMRSQKSVIAPIDVAKSALYMVLVKYTTRWTVERADMAASVIDSRQGLIALTWHSRFLMLNSAWKKHWQKPHVLISLSRDGALVAYTTRFLGLKTVRGSARKAGSTKSKGGSGALREMMAALDNKACIVITPDGPRGPRQRLGDGPLGLSRLSGAPILPCTFAVRNRIQFKSWDRFVLPLPFGRGIIIWGTPLTVPADASEEELGNYKKIIEDEMNAFLKEADTRLGRTPVEPAEVKS